MNLGYPTSKNRVTQNIALTEEQSFRLRRMASEKQSKLSPFVGTLIDLEWERRKRPDSEIATPELVEVPA